MTDRGCRWVVRFLCVAAAVAILLFVARDCHSQGWGCFVQEATIRDAGGNWTPSLWRQHVRLMKRAGMNTFTIEYRSADQLRRIVDIAIEEGMLDTGIPVFIIGGVGPDQARADLGDEAFERCLEAGRFDPQLSGWGMGETRWGVAEWELARSGSRFADRWPEPIGYGPDEPGNGDPERCPVEWCPVRPSVAAVQRIWHAVGWRHGTAVMHPHIVCLARALDIVVANVIIGAEPGLREQRAECEQRRREFWLYEIHARSLTPEMIRWQMGWLFWQTQARVHLSWSWADFLDDPKAPTFNEKLRAYRLGVSDYRRLERLSDRAQTRRRALWDGEGWPAREFAEATARDGNVNGAVPRFDFGRLVPE